MTDTDSRQGKHSAGCECERCVLVKTDARTRKAILSELAIHGAIGDSWDAERRAEDAIARALLKLAPAPIGEAERPKLSVEGAVRVPGEGAMTDTNSRQPDYVDHRCPEIGKNTLQGAFVSGAKWWESTSTGGTMWASDRDKAWAEAEKRYPAPAPTGEAIKLGEHARPEAGPMRDTESPSGVQALGSSGSPTSQPCPKCSALFISPRCDERPAPTGEAELCPKHGGDYVICQHPDCIADRKGGEAERLAAALREAWNGYQDAGEGEGYRAEQRLVAAIDAAAALLRQQARDVEEAEAAFHEMHDTSCEFSRQLDEAEAALAAKANWIEPLRVNDDPELADAVRVEADYVLMTRDAWEQEHKLHRARLAAKDAEIARLREEPGGAEPPQDTTRMLMEAVEIAANTCSDVTRLGRFARSVDPVRWVEQLEAHLRAVLSAAGAAPPPPQCTGPFSDAYDCPVHDPRKRPAVSPGEPQPLEKALTQATREIRRLEKELARLTAQFPYDASRAKEDPS